MTRRWPASATLALLGLSSIAAGTLLAAARPSPSGMVRETAPVRDSAISASSTPRAVLLQIFRGDSLARQQEVSITTIFPERTFSVLADTDVEIGSEAELTTQVRDLFSLQSIVSLGSSLVALSGGSAFVDDGGSELKISIRGQLVSDHAARLVVSAVRGGEETVATSVVARFGRTVVLAGPGGAGSHAEERVLFLCLTVLPTRSGRF